MDKTISPSSHAILQYNLTLPRVMETNLLLPYKCICNQGNVAESMSHDFQGEGQKESGSFWMPHPRTLPPRSQCQVVKGWRHRPGTYMCRLQVAVPAEPSLQEISAQAPDMWGQKPSEDDTAQLFETSSQPFKISQLRPRYQGDARHPHWALSRLFTDRIYE